MVIIFYKVEWGLKLLKWVTWEMSSTVGKAAQCSGLRGDQNGRKETMF